MKFTSFPYCIFLVLLCIHCKRDSGNNEIFFEDGGVFDSEGSDPEAIWVAEDAIAASGGDQAWQSTNCIKWNMFGQRWVVWDKEHGKVRVENSIDGTQWILDLPANKIKLFKDGREWTDKDTLAKYLPIAYKVLREDVEWLAMPFKLKDPAVHLRYIREDTTITGINCDVISITYDSASRNKDKKYEVWVGKNSSLIAQWAIYNAPGDTLPGILTTWDGYVKYGDVFISSDRGDQRQITGIKVYEALPASVFEDFTPIDFANLQFE